MKYRIDFFLPKYGFEIELKDNHVWHKKQVESGKWKAKEDSAINFCKTKGYRYFLLFPKDIEKFFYNLERDSLNNDKSHWN